METKVKPKTKLIVVLGMHRSGTSAVTRGLQVLGVNLGDRLMPAHQEFNAKGFWEDIDLNDLNMEILEALNSDWHHLAPISSNDIETLAEKGYFDRAVELLRSKIGSSPIFGFKDPRIPKLMPFWKKVFSQSQFDLGFVLTLRHPLSVVKSLQKRDGLDSIKSYLLWIEHVLTSLSVTMGEKRVLVDYDRLMEAPEQEISRMAKCFDLKVDLNKLRIYRSDFLDEALRHTVYGSKELNQDESCPALVREIYAGLLDVARDQLELDGPDLPRKVSRWLEEFDRIKPILILVDKLGLKIEAVSEAVMDRDGQISQLGKIIAERDNQISGLNQILSDQGIQISNLRNAVAEGDRRIVDLNQSIAIRDGQIDHLKQFVAERETEIMELNEETVRRGKWALGLEQQLKDARLQIVHFTSSNSWRITFPLREAKQWLVNPSTQIKRYLRGLGLLGKRIYLSLPLSQSTKDNHKLFFSRYLSWNLHPTVDPILSIPRVPKLKAPIERPLKDLLASAEGIRLPNLLKPIVSIVIPVYGKCDFTIRCLTSIASNPPSFPFEVIVIDDFSPDMSLEVLRRVKGIRLISNSQNQGFIRSCNIGAKAASGQYLYFLNNDTEVTSNWLDELVRTFMEFPGTGLVGSKLIYPDGTLQEAGGIIWQDGSAWNFGRNQDPALPVYNYAREVDYCSGASIMIPKNLFEDLEGFDEYYLPAYCEDSDLALKIKEKGLRVIYQPLSVVVHYEGVTSGTDTAHGHKAYQIENLKKQYHRWKQCFEKYQPNGVNLDDAKDRMSKHRVLVLDHCTPTPNQDAGSIIVFNMGILLREMGFQVTFIPEDNFMYMPKDTAALQRSGIEVLYAPYYLSVEQHLKESGGRYDLVLLFRPGVVERHLNTIRKYCPQAKVIFHTVDLHYLRMSREADMLGREGKLREAREMKKKELEAIRSVDATIVTSTIEFELLRSEVSNKRLYVLPLIMDIRGTKKGFKERRNVVFVGGYQHPPNVDAVKYFVQEVMPFLRRRIKGVCFYAVGSKTPVEIEALSSEDVIVAGYVEDLSTLLDEMRVAVSPLRFGAGIKGKIGTSLAVGLPMVATSLAAEGMSLRDGENILVADGAEALAEAVARLYEDEGMWEKVSRNGLEFAAKAWGGETAWTSLYNILEELEIPVIRHKYPPLRLSIDRFLS